MIKKFYIEPEFLTSITVTTAYPIQQQPNETIEDFLVRKIQSTVPAAVITSSRDHLEFTKLREMLGDMGYISIERGWWNGDRVLKKFYLNDVVFEKDEKFMCADAMKYHLAYELKRRTE